MSKKIKAIGFFVTAILVFAFACEPEMLYGTAKVAGSTPAGTNYEYGYSVCIDVTVDDQGKIIKVSDDEKNTEASIAADVIGAAASNKAYWKKYLSGKGFEKYKNLTIEDVKKMDVGFPGAPGVDAVGGATAASLADYKNPDNYKKGEQKKLEKIIKEGRAHLETLETYEEIEKALAELKQKLDALKTK